MNRINQQRLIAYRLERGLAVRQVARDCGIEIPVLNRLETSRDPSLSTISVAALCRIADHLGVAAADLLTNDTHDDTPQPPETDDPKLLGAVLRALNTDTAIVAIAASLDWDVPRVHTAADTLRQHLHPAGMTIYKKSGRISIRPLDDRHSDAVLAVRRHPRASTGQSLVTPARAKLLYRAAHKPISPHSLSRNDRLNVAVLLKAGILAENAHRFLIPAQDVTDSLRPLT